MKNIINQINQFYKLCLAEVSLEGLLSQALAEGSNDAFLVFLDMLGEINPKVAEKIKGFKRTREVLIALSKLFPELITLQNDGHFNFNVPFFIEGFKGVSLYQDGKKHDLVYDDFDYYFSHYLHLSIQEFRPIFEKKEVASVIKANNSNIIEIGFTQIEWHSNGYQNFTPADEGYEFMQEVIKNYQGKAEGDLIKIKNLFKTK